MPFEDFYLNREPSQIIVLKHILLAFLYIGVCVLGSFSSAGASLLSVTSLPFETSTIQI